MLKLRWSCKVALNDGSSILACLDTDGEFFCSDSNLEDYTYINIAAHTNTSPIGVLPPSDYLKITANNPASIAAYFYNKVLDVFRDKGPSFTFSGSNFMLPGITLQDVGESAGALDGLPELAVNVSAFKPEALFDPRAIPSFERKDDDTLS